FGFRANDAATGDGLPFATGPGQKFGYTISNLGNIYNDPAGRSGVNDIAIWTRGATGLDVYLGDTNLSSASRLFVALRGGDSSVNETVANGSTGYGDLDNDGISELFAADELLSSPSALPGLLWYSDRFAAGLKLNTDLGVREQKQLASNVTPQTTGAGVTGRIVEFAGDLNGDGKKDLVISGVSGNESAPVIKGEFTILY
ncbi:MAG: hypothetical protein RL701_2231, partial [Pseudomonadota bacterium]